MAAAALARSFYHLLDRHRVDEAVGFLDDSFRGHGMGSDRTGFRAEASAWLAAFPDLRISIEAWSLRDLNGLWVQLGALPDPSPITPTHDRSST